MLVPNLAHYAAALLSAGIAVHHSYGDRTTGRDKSRHAVVRDRAAACVGLVGARMWTSPGATSGQSGAVARSPNRIPERASHHT